jgi:hypothetical protein
MDHFSMGPGALKGLSVSKETGHFKGTGRFKGTWAFQRDLGVSKGLSVSKEPKFSQEQDGIGNWILLDIV